MRFREGEAGGRRVLGRPRRHGIWSLSLNRPSGIRALSLNLQAAVATSLPVWRSASPFVSTWRPRKDPGDLTDLSSDLCPERETVGIQQLGVERAPRTAFRMRLDCSDPFLKWKLINHSPHSGFHGRSSDVEKWNSPTRLTSFAHSFIQRFSLGPFQPEIRRFGYR